MTQRELRKASGEIVGALAGGESFIVTRNGVPIGELRPVQSRRFVAAGAALAAFSGAPLTDAARLREDVDAHVDQDPDPRA
jgi:antitoxin (DNA-binding transcriptional repressor) of toxin-antitoxin stability system